MIRASLLALLLLAQGYPRVGPGTAAPHGGGALRPDFVPNQLCENDGNFSGTSLTVVFGTCVNPQTSTITSNVASSNALVISTYTTGVTVTSATCGGVAATLVVTQLPGQMFLCPNSPGGAVNVTVNYSSSSGAYRIVAQEYLRTATSPLDGSGSFDCGAGCSTSAVAVGLSTAVANDTVVEWCLSSGTGITPGATPIAFTGRYLPAFGQITADGAAVGTGAQSPSCDNYSGALGEILALALHP